MNSYLQQIRSLEETLVKIHCFLEDENGEHEKQQDEWIQVLDDFLERFRLETDISLEVDSCSLFNGCPVVLNQRGILGRVRFLGNTHLGEGLFAGIELLIPIGRHDGEVDGHRYFTCLPRYGVLCKIENCQLLWNDIHRSHEWVEFLCRSRNRCLDLLCSMKTFSSLSPRSEEFVGEEQMMYLEASLEENLRFYLFDLTSFSLAFRRVMPTLRLSDDTGDDLSSRERQKSLHSAFCDTLHMFQTFKPLSIEEAQEKDYRSEQLGRDRSSSPSLSEVSSHTSDIPEPSSLRLSASHLRHRSNSLDGEEMNGKSPVEHSSPQNHDSSSIIAPGDAIETYARIRFDRNGRAVVLSLGDFVQLRLPSRDGTPYRRSVKGSIAYLGELAGKEGCWVGVELSTSDGLHNGTVDNISYFSCLPNRGIFIRPSCVYVIRSTENTGDTTRGIHASFSSRSQDRSQTSKHISVESCPSMSSSSAVSHRSSTSSSSSTSDTKSSMRKSGRTRTSSSSQPHRTPFHIMEKSWNYRF